MCKKVISLLRDTRRFYAPPLQAMLAETVSRNVSVEAVMAQPMYKRLVVDLRGFMANCVVRGDPCELHEVHADARAWLMCCPPRRASCASRHDLAAARPSSSVCSQPWNKCMRSCCKRMYPRSTCTWTASARATVMPQAYVT